MKRYREFMSRGECLFNALLSCIIPVLLILFFLLAWSAVPASGRGVLLLLLVLELGSCAFHWYRYLAYNQK